jgi:hypothetical protein
MRRRAFAVAVVPVALTRASDRPAPGQNGLELEAGADPGVDDRNVDVGQWREHDVFELSAQKRFGVIAQSSPAPTEPPQRKALLRLALDVIGKPPHSAVNGGGVGFVHVASVVADTL